LTLPDGRAGPIRCHDVKELFTAEAAEVAESHQFCSACSAYSAVKSSDWPRCDDVKELFTTEAAEGAGLIQSLFCVLCVFRGEKL
jgi:hypothetical protein